MPLWLAIVACLAQPGTTSSPATPQPAAPTPAVAPAAPTTPSAPVGGYASADELLTALERADEGLDRLRADVRHDVLDDLAGDRQVRIGELFFERVKPDQPGGKAVRKFGVRFTKSLAARAERNEVRIHAFDGRWYADKVVADKRISRREVVAPGDTFDPLKLGEGPLPIPIGQKKADILARYNVELLPPEAGLSATEPELIKFVEGSVQLRLTPKTPGGDNYKEIRLWYRGKKLEAMGPGDRASDRLLPRLARTEGSTADPTAGGNVTLIQLANVDVNADAKIDADVLSTAAPEGWEVTETPLRKSAPEPAAAPEPKKDEKPDAK